jgi:hypothetical protein
MSRKEGMWSVALVDPCLLTLSIEYPPAEWTRVYMYRGHKIHIARPLAVIASCIIVYAQRDDTYIVYMYKINTFSPDVLVDLLIMCLCIKQL